MSVLDKEERSTNAGEKLLLACSSCHTGLPQRIPKHALRVEMETIIAELYQLQCVRAKHIDSNASITS